ncbi:MAG: hypothetical protein HY304_09285 [candidate division Zixibacteria bacterium]|nr:hypothetical protein [candidate division Zixibacteria bacterium]
MKRLLLAIGLAMLFGATARAMNTEDIIDLCHAGFSAERIAKIVDAAGLDQPLTGADWARIRSEGCGDAVVDALLGVLVQTGNDSVEEESEQPANRTDDNDQNHTNIYLSGGWGWNGGYGSAFWGYDPYWSVGWGYYDPFWSWNWYASDPFWWDRWYGPRFYHEPYRYGYCDPFYYSGHNYVGGYYSGGFYARQRVARRGGMGITHYAVVKSSPAVQRSTYVVARSKPYRGVVATTAVNRGTFAYAKRSGATVTTSRGGAWTTRRKSISTTSVMTTRSQAQRARGTGAGSTSTNPYARRKTSGSTGVARPSTGAVQKRGTSATPPTSTTPSTGQPAAKRKGSGHGGSGGSLFYRALSSAPAGHSEFRPSRFAAPSRTVGGMSGGRSQFRPSHFASPSRPAAGMSGGRSHSGGHARGHR